MANPFGASIEPSQAIAGTRYFGSTLRASVDQFCILFEGSRAEYGKVEWILFLCTLGLALLAWPSVTSRLERGRITRGIVRCGPAVFLVSMIATLFVCRWPVIASYDVLGFDESNLLSGAITLKYDPIFWRTVQSTTSGPLNVYPLMLPALLGMPLDYAAARIIDAAIMAICLVLLFKTFRLLTDDAVARLAVLPAWCFFATATSQDFVQYTSEAVPMLIQTLAVFLTIRWLVRPDASWRLLWVVGLLLGMLPFAKVQAVPAGIALAVCISLTVVIRRRESGSVRILLGRLGAFVLCGVLPSLFVLAFVAVNGLTSRFLHAFVRFNLSFAAANRSPFLSSIRSGATACFTIPEFSDLSQGLCIGAAAVVAVALGAVPRLTAQAGRSLRNHWPLAAVLCAPLAASFLAITARAGLGTQWYFFHYVLFLVVPLTLAVMKLADWIGARIVIQGGAALRWSGLRHLATLIVAAVPVGLMAPRLTETTKVLTSPQDYLRERRDASALLISKLARPGDALVVWGWRADLYVQTQLRQGVSFATIEREVGIPGVDAETAYFRAQFIQDIQQAQPIVIVDSTGPSDSTYHDRRIAGHEVFPEFADFVQRNCTSLGESQGYRIYVRNPAPPLPPTGSASD